MKKPRIFNTGMHLGKPSRIKQLSFLSRKDSIILPKLKQQSRKDKTIFYGSYAVNAQLPRAFHRPHGDFDIFSRKQRTHAIQVEQHIDRSTNSDMVHVKQLPHPLGRGMQLYRVEMRSDDTALVDFSPMKRTKTIVKNGVRFETIPEAKKKYRRMLRTGDRFVKPTTDLARIEEYETVKRFKRRRLF